MVLCCKNGLLGLEANDQFKVVWIILTCPGLGLIQAPPALSRRLVATRLPNFEMAYRANQAVGATRTRNVNLFDTVVDDRDGLKIVAPGASVDFVELITRVKARALWKVGQAFEQVAEVGPLLRRLKIAR